MKLRSPLFRSAGWIFTAASIACAVPDAHATTTTRLSLQEMVDTADTIVIGRAVGAETVWIGRSLYTRYRVAVDETLHGESTIEVAVVVPGGVDQSRAHPIAVVIPDAPMMQRDEPVALLLSRSDLMPGRAFTIVGFNQGRIRLAAPGTKRAASSNTLRAAPDANAQAAHTNQVRTKLQDLVATRGQPAAMRSAPARGAAGGQPLPNVGARRLP